MGKLSPVTSSVKEEKELIAALERLIESLESKKSLEDDSRNILANLGSRLISLSTSSGATTTAEETEEAEEDTGIDEIENHLNMIQEKIASFEEQTLIWDSGPEEASDCLNSIEKAQKLMKILENRSTKDDTLLRLANDVLQRGMARLEQEFRVLLVQKQQFRESNQTIDASSVISSGDDSLEDEHQRESSTAGASEEHVIELLPPDVIGFLRGIANLIFNSNYGHECSRVYIDVRKDALDDCLCDLEIEKLSIDDVLKMEWEELDCVIMKWIWAIKHFVRVQLTSEKSLADQIFGDIESVSRTCFTESSKTSLLVFLNFCEAICLGPCRPEKLIRVLNMYEVLSDLIPKISSLFSLDAGSCITEECQDILGRLGDCSKSTYLEFRRATASNSSESVKPGGGVHALTSYVMNYLKILTDSRRTFDEVMKDLGNDHHCRNEDHVDDESNITPTKRHFRSIIMILECNLEEISKLYRDESLRHLFLMNNLHYIAEKSKGPELVAILGEEWIRKRIPKFQNHAMEYQKATWNPILAFLRDEGINNPFSNSASRTILKERFRCFYLSFEDVYRNQTGWIITDSRLRDDLTISISLKVIQAYRSFVGRYGQHIIEKHIKYTADDLEGFLLDLFSGSHRSLHGGLRR